MYKLTQGSSVIRLSDGVQLPADPANGDYAVYLMLVDQGYVPEPADVPPPPTKTQQIDSLLAAKGVTRLVVQLTIEVSEDKARALAATYGLTEVQALAYAYSKNKTYRECKDLEVAIRAIEVAP